eukprot:448782_1
MINLWEKHFLNHLIEDIDVNYLGHWFVLFFHNNFGIGHLWIIHYPTSDIVIYPLSIYGIILIPNHNTYPDFFTDISRFFYLSFCVGYLPGATVHGYIFHAN